VEDINTQLRAKRLETIMKKTSNLRTLSVILAAVMALSACNTLEGAGRDIGSAGDAIEDAAKKN